MVHCGHNLDTTQAQLRDEKDTAEMANARVGVTRVWLEWGSACCSESLKL